MQKFRIQRNVDDCVIEVLIVADELKAFELLFSHDLVKAAVKRKGLSFIAEFYVLKEPQREADEETGSRNFCSRKKSPVETSSSMLGNLLMKIASGTTS